MCNDRQLLSRYSDDLSLYRILDIMNYIRVKASAALGCSLFLSGWRARRRR